MHHSYLSRLFPAPKDRKEFEDRFEEFRNVADKKIIKVLEGKQAP